MQTACGLRFLTFLLLVGTDEMAVQNAVHHQHVVAARLGVFDVGVLVVGIGGVEVNQVLVLVGLLLLDEFLVFLDGVIFAFGVLEKEEFSARS